MKDMESFLLNYINQFKKKLVSFGYALEERHLFGSLSKLFGNKKLDKGIKNWEKIMLEYETSEQLTMVKKKTMKTKGSKESKMP